MFSQPSFKRINMQPGYMPMSNMGGYNYQMEYPMMQNMNDNLSYYSSASTATNMTQNIKKKNFYEEFNSILSSTIEGLIPKVAEECADMVFTKICHELDKQSKEIDEMRNQLGQLEGLLKDKLNLKIFTSQSTPFRNLKNLSGELSDINSLIADQSSYMREMKDYENAKKPNERCQDIFGNLNEKLRLLKGDIDEERKAADRLNHGITDRYVDLLGIKNIIDDKVGYLINDIKYNLEEKSNARMEENEAVICEMVSMVDLIYDKIQNPPVRKQYKNLEIESHERTFVKEDLRLINDENINMMNLTYKIPEKIQSSSASAQVKSKQMTQKPTPHNNRHGKKALFNTFTF